jgi:hypothetical protein
MFHRELESLWNGWLHKSCNLITYPQDTDLFEYAKAQALMDGYRIRWENEPYEIIGVEVPFETDMINPETGRASRTYRLAGKIDAIVRHTPTGHVWIVEHKTSAEDISLGSDYWKRLRMDSQISNYFAGARSLGYDVVGCLYDVIGKPGQKPLKRTAEIKLRKDGLPYANQRVVDETPEEYGDRIRLAIAEDPNRYYVRGEVARLEKDLDDAAFDTWHTAEFIRMSERTGKHPRNPKSCNTPGYSCPFFSVCCGEASIDDPALFQKSEHTHPELEK